MDIEFLIKISRPGPSSEVPAEADIFQSHGGRHEVSIISEAGVTHTRIVEIVPETVPAQARAFGHKLVVFPGPRNDEKPREKRAAAWITNRGGQNGETSQHPVRLLTGNEKVAMTTAITSGLLPDGTQGEIRSQEWSLPDGTKRIRRQSDIHIPRPK